MTPLLSPGWNMVDEKHTDSSSISDISKIAHPQTVLNDTIATSQVGINSKV